MSLAAAAAAEDLRAVILCALLGVAAAAADVGVVTALVPVMLASLRCLGNMSGLMRKLRSGELRAGEVTAEGGVDAVDVVEVAMLESAAMSVSGPSSWDPLLRLGLLLRAGRARSS